MERSPAHGPDRHRQGDVDGRVDGDDGDDGDDDGGGGDDGGDDELVDWVDEDGAVIETVTRARMRRENLRHRSTAVVVLSADGRRLLVHRRADTKDLRPGWWDVCAGGVVRSGEDLHDSAVRELAEELGVEGLPLQRIGSGRFDADDSREIAEVFLVHCDGPFTFADGEVTAARFVDRDGLRSLMRTERFLPSCDGMILPLVAGFEP